MHTQVGHAVNAICQPAKRARRGKEEDLPPCSLQFRASVLHIRRKKHCFHQNKSLSAQRDYTGRHMGRLSMERTGPANLQLAGHLPCTGAKKAGRLEIDGLQRLRQPATGKDRTCQPAARGPVRQPCTGGPRRSRQSAPGQAAGCWAPPQSGSWCAPAHRCRSLMQGFAVPLLL